MDYKSLNPIGKLAKVFLDQYRITIVITIAIIFAGLFAYNSLPRESTPEINIPIAVVLTTYPGASPEDIESQITDKIENKVSELDDIDQITSTSSVSSSLVMIDFETNVDMDLMVQKLQNKMSEIQSQLPADANEPVVTKIEMSDVPIMNVNLISDLSTEELTEYSDIIEDELELIRGVSDVSASGTIEREISINLDADRLALYGVSVNQIVQAIEGENINFPIGEVTLNDHNYGIRVIGEFESVDEIEDLVVTYSTEGAPVYLRNLATVVDGSQEIGNYARLSQINELGEWDTLPAITLSVFKRQGENLVSVGQEVREKMIELVESETLPEIDYVITGDWAEETENEVNRLMRNVLISVGIVAVILIVFLGFYPALISSTVIPLSIGSAFMIVHLLGLTLNGLTLFGLILALGMLVDNGIVMVENIYRIIQQGNIGRRKAALLAANEIGIPLISAVLTTISAFVPMAFMSGIAGQYIRVIPLTVVFSLGSSLIIGLILVPYFASRFIPKEKTVASKKAKPSRFESFKTVYNEWMKSLLHKKWKRRGLLGMLVILFFGSFILPISGMLSTEMFPSSDAVRMTMDITLPPGTSLEKSDIAARSVEVEIQKLEGIENFVALVGSTGGSNGDPMQVSGGDSENLIHFAINLVPKEEREHSSPEMVELLRDIETPELVGATFSFFEESGGPPSDDPIVFRVRGEETDVLEAIALDLAAILEDIPGTVEVSDGIQDPLQEYQILLDREELQRVGLSTIQFADLLRTIESGREVGVYREGKEEVDLILRLREEDRDSLSDLSSLSFVTPMGLIPFNSIADIQLGSSLNSISHYELDKVLTLRSKLQPGYNGGQTLALFKEAIEDYPFPQGYSLLFGGEDQDIQESFLSLYYAMWVSIILIYLILIAQFNSFAQPLIILMSMPLALIGVFWGLFLTGYSLSFPAFIGVVALSGIVVNNAILIIDCINQQRKDGLELEAAVLAGVNLRFRPILLTTLTTVLAIIPTSLTDEVWGSLGFSIFLDSAFQPSLPLW